MIQNRVEPSGRIILTRARGAWMGNRGVIHNDQKQIINEFKHKAWITCVLEFKGRKRTMMTPGRWTELFFLDEATAFSAGHRPCFECRREDAKRFKLCWITGNPSYHFNMRTSIHHIDEIIHTERIDNMKNKVTHQCLSSHIPDGTFLLLKNKPHLFWSRRLYRWTPFGYEKEIAMPDESIVTVLTPPSIVNAFRAGYVPQISELSSPL